MVRLYDINGWVDYPTIRTLKQLRETLKIEHILSAPELVEKLGFEIDIWAFINPNKEDIDKVREFHHYNTKEEAEEEYQYIIRSS